MINIGADVERTAVQVKQRFVRSGLCRNPPAMDALYLTIDMDVFPHYQVPGVSAPAVRGVDLGVMEQVIEIVKQAATRCRFGLPLADIVELNPQLDPQGVSTKTAATLAARILS